MIGSLHTARALFRVLVLRQRVPLFLSWNITFRCNLRCQYCASCDAPRDEMSAHEVRAGLDALRRLGTRYITFGGGEPLLRKDIGEVLRYSKALGFKTYISTNGWLMSEHVEDIRILDHVNLSFDGNREVHDLVRGEGAYDKSLEALEICRSLKVPASLQCVLNKHNLGAVDDALAAAARLGAPIMFQPATRWLSTSTRPNPIAPDPADYRIAIDHIMRRKREGAPVRNSFTGLRHLSRWPEPQPIFCVAGRAISILEADGSMLACHQCQVTQFLDGAAPKGDVVEKFRAMSLPRNCVQCWCAPLVELCLIFSLRPEPIINALRNG